MPIPDDKIQRAYRVRVIIFLVCVVLAVAALSTVYQAIQTLTRLEVVECGSRPVAEAIGHCRGVEYQRGQRCGRYRVRSGLLRA